MTSPEELLMLERDRVGVLRPGRNGVECVASGGLVGLLGCRNSDVQQSPSFHRRTGVLK